MSRDSGAHGVQVVGGSNPPCPTNLTPPPQQLGETTVAPQAQETLRSLRTPLSFVFRLGVGKRARVSLLTLVGKSTSVGESARTHRSDPRRAPEWPWRLVRYGTDCTMTAKAEGVALKIIIIFFGLITHVNQPMSLDNTAVLPHAKHHVALLLVPRGLIAPIITPEDRWLSQWVNGDGTYAIKLDGLKVRLKGTRGIFADLKETHQKHVPKLSRLVPNCSRLKAAVLNRTPNTQFSSFFDYRAGDVEPYEYFGAMAYFPDSQESSPRCVACKVKFEALLRDDHAVLVFEEKDGTKHTYQVAGNSILTVQNIPTQPTKGHYVHHYTVLENCWGPALENMGECINTPKCKLGIVPYPGIDCANSQYP